MSANDDDRPSDVVLRLVDEVDHERAASALRHENEFLRAQLRGRARLEPGQESMESLHRAAARVAELESRVADLTGQRDQLTTRIHRLETEVRAGQLLSDRLTAFERRLTKQAESFDRFEELRRVERDEHTARQSAWIAELEDRLDRAEQARGDLRLLLARIETTPLRFLLRRRAGYRAMEDRWR